jgi:antitoxin component YwqK of YwqJK toxin-antitoxin module
MKRISYLTVILTLSYSVLFAQDGQDNSVPGDLSFSAAGIHPEYRSPNISGGAYIYPINKRRHLFSPGKKNELLSNSSSKNTQGVVKRYPGVLSFPTPLSVAEVSDADHRSFTPDANSSGLKTANAFSSTGNRNRGTVVGLSADGDTQFIAHYKRNKLKGAWLSKFGNESLCDSGSLKNNIPDGVWKSWYANGNLRYIRTYDAHKLEKAKQDIALRASKAAMSPLASIARRNVNVAWSFLHPDYSFHTLAAQPTNFSTSESWLTLNERVANNISEESAYIPPFAECLHHGLYMNFYEDGKLKDSGYYRNGLREGIWEEWVEDGKVRSQGFYNSGHKADTWKFHDQSGRLLYIKSYDRNGREVHRKRFRDL